MTRPALTLAFATLAAFCAGSFVSPALAQKAKDTLRFPMSDGESAIDPYLIPGVFNNIWEPSIWDNLLGFDSKNVKFSPLLAKNWSQPDPTTYDYELRDDVTWHDGQKLDADDVVYTINYLIDPKINLRYKSNWAWLKSIEKLGPYKVRITSKTPVPDGMMWMAYNTPIFPEHIHGPLADKQAFGSKPVGTGPLKIAKIDKNAGIVAEKNAAFKVGPSKAASGVGRIVAEVIPDSGTVVAKLLRGEVDMGRDLPADQALALKDSGHFEFTLSPPALGYSILSFPTTGQQSVKALADVRVRQAIIKAIDRKALLIAQYGDLGKTMSPHPGLCSKEQLGCGYTKDVPDYDPAGAKKLLAEAGYPDGFDVTIAASTSNEATAVAGMLRQVGIRATLRMTTLAQRIQALSQGKIEIGLFGWSGGGMFEASSQIVRHFLSNEYDDAVLTKMAAETNTMMNDAERRKAVAKVMDYAHDNAYAFPMTPIRVIFVHTKEVRLLATDVRSGQVQPHEFGWK